MAILIQYLLILNLLTSILTNMNSLCKIWTLGLGIWENNWAVMFLSRLSNFHQILIFERDYEAMKI
jgi:hypothetical protein